MQCLACGAEMSLEQITGDDAAPVSGFERRTFVCSACGDTEQRLAFVKQVEPGLAAAVPMGTAPSIAPSSFEHEDAAPRGIIKRIFANLSAVRGALERRLVSVSQGKAAGSPAPVTTAAPSPVESQPFLNTANIEPVAVQTEAPGLVVAESENDIEECEALLKRAIEIVQTPVRSHGNPGSDLETQPGSPAMSANLPEAEVEAPPLSGGFSETETAVPVANNNTAESELVMPAPARDVAPERPSASPVVVEIQYDAEKTRYIAKDIKTGLSILRMADLERLRHMCERLGWQVITRVPGTARESEIHGSPNCH